MDIPQPKPVEGGSHPANEKTAQELVQPQRHRLPDERRAITHHFAIGGHEGYVTVGLYEDGKVGELFIKMSKEGSTVSGLMDSFATAVSLALQHGVPLSMLCDKFSYTRFEPNGWSGNPEIGYATSLMDYLFRYIRVRFLGGEQRTLFAVPAPQPASELVQAGDPARALGQVAEVGDAPVCVHCGSLMVPNGSRCFRCLSCGHTNGCA
jgi:ribonucleoside-diphosphate reductase alpha chain